MNFQHWYFCWKKNGWDLVGTYFYQPMYQLDLVDAYFVGKLIYQDIGYVPYLKIMVFKKLEVPP